ncbi:hypothetical protein KPY62_12560 [Psychrobacter sp. TAE2020]|uniref:hypothetical protein n=1 Tax=Psychrobacter sp. TAE2020 TaxID=2846762 RepID=UPI001C10B669|nr:hypothetical protein [Psychrobacter sp. TAE2020]MBU5617905.1 hypothetical protein [Psychrobacter sp. TAE2020]
MLSKLYFLDIDYTDECRRIFSSNLERIIFISRRTDEAVKYLKLLHDRRPFILGLLEVKKIIKNRSYQLKDFSNILRELKEVEHWLEPNKNQIKLLLETHILSSDPFEYRSRRYENEEYGLTIEGFNDYEDFIEYISENLDTKVIKETLKELLTSQNENLHQIGRSIINIYKENNDFIADLKNVASYMDSTEELPNTRFLFSVLENLIKTDWISYTNLVNFLISEKMFSNITPQLIISVSTNKKHFNFLFRNIIQFPYLDFSSLGRSLAFKKLCQDISPKLFEFTLDKLISLNQDNIVLDALLFDSRQNKVIAYKYIDKILELLPNALDSKKYYDYKFALRFLLSYSEVTRSSIFAMVEEAIRNIDYFISLGSSQVGRVIEDLVEISTIESLDFIYGNNLFKYVLSIRELEDIFFKANEAEVLTWIGDDQDKINFWFTNSKFYQYNEDGIEWLEILHKLLSESNNPNVHLSYAIAHLFEMFSHGGRFSEALSKRLPFFDSLKQYLKNHNHDNLIPVVEQKKVEFQKYIELAQEEEAKESREQQGFDW